METSTKENTSGRGGVLSKWEEGEHAAITPGVRWNDVDP